MSETPLENIVRPGVNRGLDFVVIEELRKRTGVSSEAVLPFALSEMLCNALDNDATEISMDVQEDSGFDRLTIADNGTKKLSLAELKLILDFENKASSKRGFLRVSRGYLGNALKCIFGYSYALAESKGLTPPPITVASGNCQYAIYLKPDRIRVAIEKEVVQAERQDDGFTVFTVKFPRDVDVSRQLKSIIFASSMVNPTVKISFNMFGEQGTLGTAGESKAIRRETSVAWYTLKQFTELFEDFVRAAPGAQLKDFIAMFRGFTGRKVIGEILQELNAANHDSQATALQFFPTSTLKDLPVQTMFALMKAKTKPIKKRSIAAVLGLVGKEAFEQVKQENGWERLRYIALSANVNEYSDNVEYPYLIELAVFDRNDSEGLKVYSCVNFMASTEPILSKSFDVNYRLGRVGITKQHHVTVVVHAVCPVLKWLNYGKNALDALDQYGLMQKAFDKVLPIPKTPREYHPPPVARPLSWVPHGSIGDSGYEVRLKAFAAEIKALQSQRTMLVKYSSRGWCYMLEGVGKIDKGEFLACQKAINDCRKIGFLPIDFVAEDQDTTRHFRGIHNASDPTVLLREIKNDVAEMLRSLPSSITDYWVGEKYYLMMCVEKGDLKNLFKSICDEYHIPIVSSKGWAPILLRGHIAQLSKKAEANGLTPVMLLFYDHDPAGLKITDTFRKNLEDCRRATGWDPSKLIIERFGLNEDDIDRLGLTWISNVKTGSGRESRDWKYLRKYGTKKCEANALFKNDETLKAAVDICRKAIEKYYGVDARERFERKEEESEDELADIYANPIWENFGKAISNVLDSFKEPKRETVPEDIPEAEEEVEVFVDNKYLGNCKCKRAFDYGDSDIGKLKRCRQCGTAMRLRLKAIDQ